MMNFLISTNIIVLVILITLIAIVAYKVLFKKKRPKVTYMPFDYITGQSKDEFIEEADELEEEDNKKNVKLEV